MTESARVGTRPTGLATPRLMASAAALWALAAAGGVWFMVAAANWEQSHPDVEDHGVAFFVGLLLAGASALCALAWLLPTLLLRRGRPRALAAGVVTAVLTSPLAGMVLLVLLIFDNWARWLTLAVLLSQSLGVAGVIQAYVRRTRRKAK